MARCICRYASSHGNQRLQCPPHKGGTQLAPLAKQALKKCFVLPCKRNWGSFYVCAINLLEMGFDNPNDSFALEKNNATDDDDLHMWSNIANRGFFQT